MPEQNLAANEEESTITYISIPIYQIHVVNPVIFCVDTEAPYSYIGNKALERIFRQSRRWMAPIKHSNQDFKFGNTLVWLKVLIERILRTPVTTPDNPILLDLVDVEISALQGLDVLDGSELLVNNVTNSLWDGIIIRNDPVKNKGVWKIRLMRKGDHLLSFWILTTFVNLTVVPNPLVARISNWYVVRLYLMQSRSIRVDSNNF